MRLLESETREHFESINATLVQLDAGECLISGKLELYSAKPDAPDKQLSRRLEQKFEEWSGPYEDSNGLPTISPTSPYGGSPFAYEASTRKTFVQLIATLNQAFPDYDFSSAKPQCFIRESSAEMVVNSVSLSLGKALPEVHSSLWAPVDEAIGMKDAEIYSFNDPDSGLDDGKIWSFNLFFLNRKTHRILFFCCSAESKSCLQGDEDAEMYEEEEETSGKNYGFHYSRIEGGKNFGFHFRVPDAEDAPDFETFDFDPEDEFDY